MRTLATMALLAIGSIVATGSFQPHGEKIWQADAAATTKPYTNSQYGYSLRYPAAWSVQHIPTKDIFPSAYASVAQTATLFGNPTSTTGTAVFALVVPGTDDVSALKRAARHLLLYHNTPTSPVVYAVRTINGVTYQDATNTIQVTTLVAQQHQLATTHHHSVYFFGSLVTLHRSTTATEMATVNHLLDSITLR